MSLIGRKTELELLAENYKKDSSTLTPIYGRRRIGKSSLIKHFIKNKPAYYLEGIEGLRTPEQIKSATMQLAEQGDIFKPLHGIEFKTWQAFFSDFTERIKLQKIDQKVIIVLDEVQWLAARRSKLISILKFFWDNHWKDYQIDLILCGSITSYMLKKVIRSKALYGRINQIIHLEGLLPKDVKKFFTKRNIDEALKYMLLFGGVPKYLEEINPNKSFEQNINTLCFLKNSIMKDEFERIFYSQFPEYQLYQRIILSLSKGAKSHSEIAKICEIGTGGGLSNYLKTLEAAGYIEQTFPLRKIAKNLVSKYYISDPYIAFYLKYIKPNLKIIKQNKGRNLFQQIVKTSWSPWMGLAFERFCRTHAMDIAEKLAFAEHVISFGQVLKKDQGQYQIDLTYLRSDNVITICEIKYLDTKVTSDVIAQLERKKSLLTLPAKYTLETALITLSDPAPVLQKSGYFNYILTAKDLF